MGGVRFDQGQRHCRGNANKHGTSFQARQKGNHGGLAQKRWPGIRAHRAGVTLVSTITPVAWKRETKAENPAETLEISGFTVAGMATKLETRLPHLPAPIETGQSQRCPPPCWLDAGVTGAGAGSGITTLSYETSLPFSNRNKISWSLSYAT